MKRFKGEPAGEGKRVALVVSRFNEKITELLEKGAVQRLLKLGVEDEDIDIFSVPGAFEVPPLAERLSLDGDYDAIIALGAIIRGETAHFDFVAKEAAFGIAEASRTSEVPIIFGILTTENEAQALERANPEGRDVGGYSAEAALEMASLYELIT